MSFFDAPTPDERREMPPVWLFPPDELGHFVGMRRVLLQTPDSGIVLTDVVAYSCGFMFGLDVMRQDGDAIDVLGTTFDVRVGRVEESKILKVTITFADGRSATNAALLADDYMVDPEPGEVRLAEHGGGGSGFRRRVEYWVTPLPPAGQISFVLEWGVASDAPFQTDLDADPIIEGAKHSLPIWNDPDSVNAASV